MVPYRHGRSKGSSGGARLLQKQYYSITSHPETLPEVFNYRRVRLSLRGSNPDFSVALDGLAGCGFLFISRLEGYR